MSISKQQTCWVSAIVPAYNCADSIAATVKSLLAQTVDQEKLEIILVNDGSADSTLESCNSLAANAPNIIVIDKPNGGVGSARNAGIEAARGKYIAFLDSDDTLLPETLEAAVHFFDQHYDEIDLVTYPMLLFNEKREWSHVREKVLTETGVYDLTKLQYAFSLITNVNVIVKNDDSLPRFREDLLIHEDELFFMNVLLRKQKVGFCKKGAYRYHQRPGSAISTKMHPYYQFEKNIGFWEELFGRYDDKAPVYLQASFLNEINWKLRKDLVFPYHYNEDAFERAVNRIRTLMDRVDDDVILTSPRADDYYHHYLVHLKPSARLSCTVVGGTIALRDGEDVLLCRNHVEADIVKTRVFNGELKLTGILRSVLFEYVGKPRLFLLVDDANPFELPLFHTLSDFHVGHTRTNTFWKFEADIPFKTCSSVSFLLVSKGSQLPIKLAFSSKANLDTQYGIDSFSACGREMHVGRMRSEITIANASPLSIAKSRALNTRSTLKTNRRAFLIRSLYPFRRRQRKPLWLYYDRGGVGGDNAYLQFIHDLPQDDGINRYYVARESRTTLDKMFDASQRRHVVDFSSTTHRFMHLDADRIITSYIEHENWCPFTQKSLRGLADIIHYDIVYLQHGVLHAHMPWKFGADNRLFDYEVVSTQFEIDNLVSNYGFQRKQLLESGMPRYDLVDPNTAPQRKILFAPSWRKNLVAEQQGLRFTAKKSAFLESSFWKASKRFLESEALHSLLQAYDYTLDVKLHPIFSIYEDKFRTLESDRVRIVDSVTESDYQVFVTDYSSWVFDFVYLKRAIAYFLPDEREFKAGLNGYRELDLPLEDGFGPLAKTADDLVNSLEGILRRGGSPDARHASKMDGFFLHYDNSQRDRLYEALMASWRERTA